MFDFTNKVVFVAGGTSGINLAIAEAFAAAGASVAVLSRSQQKVEAAVKLLNQHSSNIAGFTADVRDFAGTQEALRQAHDKLGPFDVLISGAAGNFPAPALGMSANAFKSVVDIDLLGTFNVLRAGFEFLHKPGACIINISAPQAYCPMELQMHVCAAKAGVDMITRVAALEWAPFGIRVNSVVPGPIDDTEGMKRLAPTAEIRSTIASSVPLGRLGTKQDVANACLWLCTPAASYITGVVLAVDGGWSLGGAASSASALKNAFFKQ
ncbi:MAG: SDR family oxidoreductase [Acidobacteriota bacterium]|nr:SDR family oxidoreductase [Blastocatellia bacterium]MDW8411934.1 SDR family oxidoreductase [Acidobacteriota bacterium]